MSCTWIHDFAPEGWNLELSFRRDSLKLSPSLASWGNCCLCTSTATLPSSLQVFSDVSGFLPWFGFLAGLFSELSRTGNKDDFWKTQRWSAFLNLTSCALKSSPGQEPQVTYRSSGELNRAQENFTGSWRPVTLKCHWWTGLGLSHGLLSDPLPSTLTTLYLE